MQTFFNTPFHYKISEEFFRDHNFLTKKQM